MTPFEVNDALKSMVVLVDTREQDTPALHLRLKRMGCPFERKKLSFGDYSAKCRVSEDEWLDISDKVTVERKMSFDELCNCYCKGRERFVKEFERAKEAGAKIYLMIENASWEKAYSGAYRSKMEAKALVASLTAWQVRYNCQIIFCDPATSGALIHEFLYRELKQKLEGVKQDSA